MTFKMQVKLIYMIILLKRLPKFGKKKLNANLHIGIKPNQHFNNNIVETNIELTNERIIQ